MTCENCKKLEKNLSDSKNAWWIVTVAAFLVGMMARAIIGW